MAKWKNVTLAVVPACVALGAYMMTLPHAHGPERIVRPPALAAGPYSVLEERRRRCQPLGGLQRTRPHLRCARRGTCLQRPWLALPATPGLAVNKIPRSIIVNAARASRLAGVPLPAHPQQGVSVGAKRPV